jgi:hypothetical protein
MAKSRKHEFVIKRENQFVGNDELFLRAKYQVISKLNEYDNALDISLYTDREIHKKIEEFYSDILALKRDSSNPFISTKIFVDREFKISFGVSFAFGHNRVTISITSHSKIDIEPVTAKELIEAQNETLTITPHSTMVIVDGADNDGRGGYSLAKPLFDNKTTKYVFLDRNKDVIKFPLWVESDSKLNPPSSKLVEMINSFRGDSIIFIDIAPTEEQYDNIHASQKWKIAIYDHHKLRYSPNVREYHYDEKECGTSLFWLDRYKNNSLRHGEELVKYIKDRDLFIKKYNPDTDIIYHAVKSADIASDNTILTAIKENRVNTLIGLGKPLYEEYIEKVEELSKEFTVGVIDGVSALFFRDVPKIYLSDTLNVALKANPNIEIAINQNKHPEKDIWFYGVRSISGKATALAELYGGGGHPNGNTAGFKTTKQLF